MDIELSAAKEWQKCAKDNSTSEVVDVAIEMVTDNIVGRLERNLTVTFEQEVAKILQDTDGDPNTAWLLLKQMEGIAVTQSPQAYEQVKNQIASFR